MSRILTDQEIAALLREKKILRPGAVQKLKEPKKQVGRFNRVSTKTIDKRFSIYAQLHVENNNKFSVHVRYHPTGRGRPITLIRYNGFQASHQNKIEKTSFPAHKYHIHQLTERYQRTDPRKALAYAKITDKFDSFASAIEHVCYSYGFQVKNDGYRFRHPLFRGEST